jgi:hypothetical protein
VKSDLRGPTLWKGRLDQNSTECTASASLYSINCLQ